MARYLALALIVLGCSSDDEWLRHIQTPPQTSASVPSAGPTGTCHGHSWRLCKTTPPDGGEEGGAL